MLLFFHVQLSSPFKLFLPLVPVLSIKQQVMHNTFREKVICRGKIPPGIGPRIIYGYVILYPAPCTVFKGYFRTGTLNTWSQCVGWVGSGQTSVKHFQQTDGEFL